MPSGIKATTTANDKARLTASVVPSGIKVTTTATDWRLAVTSPYDDVTVDESACEMLLHYPGGIKYNRRTRVTASARRAKVRLGCKHFGINYTVRNQHIMTSSSSPKVRLEARVKAR